MFLPVASMAAGGEGAIPEYPAVDIGDRVPVTDGSTGFSSPENKGAMDGGKRGPFYRLPIGPVEQGLCLAGRG
jgi:hypothetical protein